MSLLGPELGRDLVSLIAEAQPDEAAKVLVFKSVDRDYFISHGGTHERFAGTASDCDSESRFPDAKSSGPGPRTSQRA
jgi:hypothetical protein